MEDTVVKIKGITGKGKNRVREHGDTWKVVNTSGTNLLLQSVKTGYMKWLGPDFAKDFALVE